MNKQKIRIGLVVLALTLFSFNSTAQRPTEGHPPSAEKVIEKLDTDKDGVISKVEAESAEKKRIAEHFDKIDTDQNGFISKEELEAMHEKRKQRRSN